MSAAEEPTPQLDETKRYELFAARRNSADQFAFKKRMDRLRGPATANMSYEEFGQMIGSISRERIRLALVNLKQYESPIGPETAESFLVRAIGLALHLRSK